MRILNGMFFCWYFWLLPSRFKMCTIGKNLRSRVELTLERWAPKVAVQGLQGVIFWVSLVAVKGGQTVFHNKGFQRLSVDVQRK